MPGTEVNLYGVGDVDLTALMTTTDKQRISYMALSLTNYDNDNEPAIAAGSFVEVGGTLFQFGVEEAITGWAGIGNDTDAYIKIIPAGATPDTVTAEFTDTAPTWSDSKQDWYGTAGAANHRYVAGVKRGTGAGDFWEKYIITWMPGVLATKIIRTEDWDMNGTASITVAHGLTRTKIRGVAGVIRDDADAASYILGVAQAGGAEVNIWVHLIGAANITLSRRTGSPFDSTDFNATSYNRGWIIINHIA